MCSNQSMMVLNDAYVGTSTGESDVVISRSVQGAGNAATAIFLIMNLSASTTVTLKLRGSYDGVAFEDVGSTTANAFGKKKISGTALSFTHYQVLVSVAGTNVAAVVRAWISQACL